MSIVLLLLLPVGLAAQTAAVKIAVFGDSLTAGYRLAADQSFPAQLEVALREKGYAVTVINAGVSGDTSAGGLARLAWTLADQPDLMIVELGANDALRGVNPAETRRNLDQILTRLKAADVAVILAGMRAPRNLGSVYYEKFDQIYPTLAQHHDVPLYPFFLEGVVGNPALNLDDGIHPTAEGVSRIVEQLLPLVEASIEALPKAS